MVVRQRREEYNQGKEKKSDMLGALLASGDHFSDDQIVDFLLALLVAGYETTSTIMTLAVKFLTETPLALAQLKVRHTPKHPPYYYYLIYIIITLFVTVFICAFFKFVYVKHDSTNILVFKHFL